MLAVIQVQSAAHAEAEIVEPPGGVERPPKVGPATPMPPPVTLCQASAICVTMVAKPSVVIAK